MGKILTQNAGGVNNGALSAITAQSGDILDGKTSIDKDGNPITGTMENISAYDSAISIGTNNNTLYFRMHKGAHITNAGSGYPELTCSYDSALNAMGISSMAGGTYIPGASQQTISCSGKRMTSDIIIPGFSMPSANSIAYGVTVITYNQSVSGTYEGYHKGNNIIYWHGSAPAENQGFTIVQGSHESGAIIARSYGNINVTFTRTFAGYGQMVIKGSGLGSNGHIYVPFAGLTATLSPSGYNGTAIVIPVTELRDRGYFATTVQVSSLSYTSYIDEIYLE